MRPQFSQPFDCGPDVLEYSRRNVSEIRPFEKADFRIEIAADFRNFQPGAAAAALIFTAQIESRLAACASGCFRTRSESIDGQVLAESDSSIESPGPVPIVGQSRIAGGAAIHENTADVA